MATANRSQRVNALRATGWPESLISTAVAVSLTEFGPQRDLVTQAKSDIRGEESYGPFQINLPTHPDVSKECASDLTCSAAAALRIYDARGNFSAWSVYNSGAYLQNFEVVPLPNGSVVGTVPTVHTDPVGPVGPVGPTGPVAPNASADLFPSFDFPHFDLVKPSHLSFPGGGFDFAGVGVDTSVLFKLGITVLIFVVFFVGVLRITNVEKEVKAVAP